MLRALLRPEKPAAAAGVAAESPAEPPRIALRERISARVPVAEAVAEAARATARVRAVIREAAGAHQAAQQAELDAEEAARTWAEAGALGNTAPSDAALLGAQRAAEAALVRARGAQAALPQLLKAEEAARAALGRADDLILEAAFAVVLAEVATPIIARAVEVRGTFVEGLHMAVALAELTTPFRWGGGHRYHGFVSGHAHAQAETALHAVAPPALEGGDPNVRSVMDGLADFARQLCNDPEATWTSD